MKLIKCLFCGEEPVMGWPYQDSDHCRDCYEDLISGDEERVAERVNHASEELKE